MRSRYYQVEIGRFTASDSYEGNKLNILSQNRYTYVEGNPINYIDPLGLYQTPYAYNTDRYINPRQTLIEKVEIQLQETKDRLGRQVPVKTPEYTHEQYIIDAYSLTKGVIDSRLFEIIIDAGCTISPSTRIFLKSEDIANYIREKLPQINTPGYEVTKDIANTADTAIKVVMMAKGAKSVLKGLSSIKISGGIR